MVVFKKKQEHSQLPELPYKEQIPKTYSKEIQEDNQKESYFSLPQMPKSQMANQLTQNTIKEEVSKNIPRTKPEEYNRLTESCMTKEVEEKPPRQEKRTKEREEDLFIKLDKFEESVESLNEIKSKIAELESFLKTIKEIKAREEKDLGEWESQIKEIKNKLGRIDDKLFSKI